MNLLKMTVFWDTTPWTVAWRKRPFSRTWLSFPSV